MRHLLLLALLLLGLLPGPVAAESLPPGLLRPFRPEGHPPVQIVGRHGSYLYLLDGVPQPIRGMGYNAILTRLEPEERAERLQRDFALMRRVGVNTLIGWDQAGFDQLLLDTAAANDLGVVMHFELGKDWDYADPALRAQLVEDVGAWVETYRDHPAVRMWGVGNEVMLVMSPEESQQFADFWVELYRAVRARDELHPVLYREAEDVKVPFFRDAFAGAGLAPESFVFGMNFYTPRIDEALASFRAHEFDVPVLISEFAPAGIAPSARAEGFRQMWARVQRHEALVLGAAPYVWATDGPEAVDRIFGLVDPHGTPVDGALAELQRLYRPGGPHEPLPDPAPRVRPSLETPLAAGVAQAIARAMSQPELEPIDLAAVEREARERYRRDLTDGPIGWPVDQPRLKRMLDLLSSASVLAALRDGDGPLYPGAVEALPLLAGMARWAATDPAAEVVAEAFFGEVIAQALRDAPDRP